MLFNCFEGYGYLWQSRSKSVIELIKTLSSEQRERMVIAYVMGNKVTLKDFVHRSMDKGGAGFPIPLEK